MTNETQQARRAAFEAAMDAQEKNPGQWLGNSYSNLYGECAWIGFNAALDSLVIELPSHEKYFKDEACCAINDCRDAIHAAGVKTR